MKYFVAIISPLILIKCYVSLIIIFFMDDTRNVIFTKASMADLGYSDMCNSNT